MKTAFSILTITFSIFIFSSCTNDGSSSNKSTTDQTNIKSKVEKPKTEILNFKQEGTSYNTDYAEGFVKAIEANKAMGTISLFKNKIIVDGDSIPFPDFPEINVPVTLKGKNKQFRISAVINRVNYTTVEYEIMLQQKSGESCRYLGDADINPYFFLGEESDEDDKTGESYFAAEFSDNITACNSFNIRIGQVKANEKLTAVGKLIIDCQDQCAVIGLENIPTLRE